VQQRTLVKPLSSPSLSTIETTTKRTELVREEFGKFPEGWVFIHVGKVPLCFA
jgi:hypothetical protein